MFLYGYVSWMFSTCSVDVEERSDDLKIVAQHSVWCLVLESLRSTSTKHQLNVS